MRPWAHSKAYVWHFIAFLGIGSDTKVRYFEVSIVELGELQISEQILYLFALVALLVYILQPLEKTEQ